VLEAKLPAKAVGAAEALGREPGQVLYVVGLPFPNRGFSSGSARTLV
jgi:ABC-type spermidine/putrescine transport system permease subunit I